MTYLKDSEIDGVKVIEYHLPPNTFYNATLNPNNIGFFKQDYIGNGVFSLKKCTGFPVVLSQPHFLNADEAFFNSVSGISKPDPDLHDIVLKLYPVIFF